MPDTTVPPLIDCSRVLYYAVVDASVSYVPHGLLYAGGELIERVPRLAIVRNLVDDTIMLLHCNESWESIAVSGGRDVDDVMVRANRDYEGLAAKWVKAGFSELDIAKALADEPRCSFCGRYHFQLGETPMVEGDAAMICGNCVNRLAGTFGSLPSGSGSKG